MSAPARGPLATAPEVKAALHENFPAAADSFAAHGLSRDERERLVSVHEEAERLLALIPVNW